MTTTVADFLLTRLRDWGVEHVFGYPGDGINGLLGAFGRAEDQPRFVQSRHEEMSAFEAVGYAKFSGKVGVCMATSGPGAIHLLNGLYDAKLDHVPVVAVVGQTNRSAMGGSYQQEVDLLSLFKDVASDYVQMVTVPEQLPNVLDRAVRTALARRAPTAVIIPNDVQELEYTPPGHEFKMVPSSLGIDWPTAVPDDAAVRRAADLLNAGSKVAMLIGQGARGARAEVLQVADLLGAGVAKALLGKDVLSDELPYVTGSIGLLGTRPSYDMMNDCDTLLTIGSSFPYTQFMPPLDQARAVQVDLDGAMIGMRYPYEVNLVGDAAATLRALIPLLVRKEDRSWQESLSTKVEDWWQTMDAEAHVGATSDAGQPDAAVRRALVAAARRRHRRRRLGLGGELVRPAPAVPGERPRVPVRDAGVHGSGRALRDRREVRAPGPPGHRPRGRRGDADERARRAADDPRYWQEWSDPRLVVAVLHNNDLNQVTWELRAMGGTPKLVESQSLPEMSYADFARSIGLHAITVEDPEQIGDAWDRALAADRPTVLDVHCDPNVPPIPPHATFEQMKDAAQAMLKGDENRWGVLKEGLKTKAQELLPHHDR